MTEAEDVTFETADAGASHTYPMQAGAIKKNGHVMLKGNPCKVVDYSTSKTGKHGHAKAHIVGLDIFTGKKYEDVCPTSHNMEVPNVKRSEYQLVDLSDDGFCTLLLESGDTKDDLMLPKDSEGNPDEVAQQVKALFTDGKSVLLTVLQACGKEKIIACKEFSCYSPVYPTITSSAGPGWLCLSYFYPSLQRTNASVSSWKPERPYPITHSVQNHLANFLQFRSDLYIAPLRGSETNERLWFVCSGPANSSFAPVWHPTSWSAVTEAEAFGQAPLLRRVYRSYQFYTWNEAHVRLPAYAQLRGSVTRACL